MTSRHERRRDSEIEGRRRWAMSAGDELTSRRRRHHKRMDATTMSLSTPPATGLFVSFGSRVRRSCRILSG